MLKLLGPSEVTLTEWNIFVHVTAGSEHFIGFDQERGLGRVSTAIQSYDEETCVGITQSGSRYQTVGAPGHVNLDALYVLKRVVFLDDIVHFWKYPIDGGSHDD